MHLYLDCAAVEHEFAALSTMGIFNSQYTDINFLIF